MDVCHGNPGAGCHHRLTDAEATPSIRKAAHHHQLVRASLTPVYWSATPILYGGNSVLPESGPQLQSSNGGGMFSSDVDTGLLTYLREIIPAKSTFRDIDNGNRSHVYHQCRRNVMALGGFNGTDPILSVSELKTSSKRKSKYFLISETQATASSSPGSKKRNRNFV
ncbi:hypothetical protein PO124_02935 [Bacillus licheniformis]|nr:hypothetical protein [Bacillus licheniformis]